MRDEELLRRILHEEADTVQPPGSFDDVVRRRRGGRRFAPVAAAAAAAALLAGVAVLLASADDRSQVASGPEATADLDGAPTTSAAPPAHDELGDGVWPFTTGAEADRFAATGSDSPYSDPTETARAFLESYLGMADPDLSPVAPGDGRSAEVVARPAGGGPETTVLLRQLGSSEVWTVVGATTDSIRLTSPQPHDPITSPVVVRGSSCCTFEGNVVVQVREDGREELADHLGQLAVIGGATGDHAAFHAEVPFAAPSRRGGAIVAFSTSPLDGSVDRATVVRVRFGDGGEAGDAPAPGSGAPLDDGSIVAVVRRPGEEVGVHALVVVDARDGTTDRELAVVDASEGGILDVALSADRRSVLYVRSTAACTSELRAVSVADGTDSVLAAPALTTPSRLAVDPRSGRLAVATDDDCDGQGELVVVSPSGTELGRWPDGTETDGEALVAGIRSLAWVDEQTLALGMQYEDGVATILHDVGSARPVGGGPQIDPAEDAAAYDLPVTTDADGTFAAVLRCCDVGAPPTAIVRIDRAGAELDRPVPTAPGAVVALDWVGSTPFWVTDAGILRRVLDGEVADLASDVVDVAG